MPSIKDIENLRQQYQAQITPKEEVAQTPTNAVINKSPLSNGERLTFATARNDSSRIKALVNMGFDRTQILTPNDPNNPVKNWALKDSSGIRPVDEKGLSGGDIAELVPQAIPAITSAVGGTIGGTIGTLAGPAGTVGGTVAGGYTGNALGEMATQKLAQILGTEKNMDYKKALGGESVIAGVANLLPGSSNIVKGGVKSIGAKSLEPLAQGTAKWIETLGGKTAATAITKLAGKPEQEATQIAAKESPQIMEGATKLAEKASKGGKDAEESFTHAQTLARISEAHGKGVPNHIGEENLRLSANKIDPLPERWQDLGGLLTDADNSIVKAHEKIESLNKKNFGDALAKVGVTDATKIPASKVADTLAKTVDNMEQSGVEERLIKPIQAKFNQVYKNNDMTYGQLKSMKDEAYKELRGMMKNGSYQEQKAQGELLKALRDAEETAIPQLKDIKPKYAESIKMQDALESINRQWAEEEQLGGTTLTGTTKISRLANERAGIGKFNTLKAVADFMESNPELKKDNFWVKTMKALNKVAFDKAKKDSGKISLVEPVETAKTIAGWLNPLGTPEKATRSFNLLARKGIIPKSYLESEANKTIGGLSPTLGALLPKGIGMKGLNIPTSGIGAAALKTGEIAAGKSIGNESIKRIKDIMQRIRSLPRNERRDPEIQDQLGREKIRFDISKGVA